MTKFVKVRLTRCANNQSYITACRSTGAKDFTYITNAALVSRQIATSMYVKLMRAAADRRFKGAELTDSAKLRALAIEYAKRVLG